MIIYNIQQTNRNVSNKQRIVPATAIHVELTGHVRLFQLDINANVKQDMRVAIVKQVWKVIEVTYIPHPIPNNTHCFLS